MGHALEFVRADIVARWKKLSGHEVFFNTGTDEHGQKLLRAAEDARTPVTQYVDESAANFLRLLPLLGISDDVHFIGTTDPHHTVPVQLQYVADDEFDRIHLSRKRAGLRAYRQGIGRRATCRTGSFVRTSASTLSRLQASGIMPS